MALGFGGPPRDDLASWLGLFHPAYLKFIAILGAVGLVMAVLAFLDLQLLEKLIQSQFSRVAPPPGTVPVDAPASRQFLDELIHALTGQDRIPASVVILGLYCTILLARAAIMYANRQIVGRLELASKNDMEREIMRNLLRKDDQFFQEHSVSVVTSRLGKDGDAINERRGLVADVWVNFVTVAGYFVFFITRNGFSEDHAFLHPDSVLLTLLGFGSIIVGVTLTNIIGRKVEQLTGAMLAKDDAIKAAIEDNLAMTPEVQVSNLQSRVVAAFVAVQERRIKPFLDMIRGLSRIGVNYQLTYLVSFVVFVYVAIRVQAGASEDITTYVTLILRTLPEVFNNLSKIATARIDLNKARPSLARLLQYSSRPIRGPLPRPGGPPPETAAAAPAQPIELKGVTYRFAPQGPLQGGADGINVTVEPNSLVAVVGGSGSGKTMLTQLILGRLPAESGAVLLGGRPMPEIPPVERAAIFAYMPQANALLDASIKENLLFGQRDADDTDAPFSPEQMDLLERTGIAQVALDKALERFPDQKMAATISRSDLSELRARLQERVTKDTGVELVKLGPGHAAPSHSVMDHILGGATDRQFVLDLKQSKQARQIIFELSETPFGSALIHLALAIIESTKELLSSCEDVEAYNRIAPFPLEETIWEMRRRFAGMPRSMLDAPAPKPSLLGKLMGGSGGPDANLPRPPLLILGLLSCPNEFDARWSPARPTGDLPEPDEAFVAKLQALLAAASDPFEADRINRRLCWRDNLLFGAPATSNSRLQTEIDAVILDEIAGGQLNDMLTNSGFSHRVGRQGKKLSGGQRQRVCLGRALMRNAGIFVLDEPTSALDPRGRRQINELLKQCASTRTIIAITHDRDLAQAADQVLMVHDGRLHASGDYETLMKNNEEFRRVIG